MLRHLIAASIVAISSLAAGAAQADWLMVGAPDFKPYDTSTDYRCSGGRGCYVAGGFTSVEAPVRIPIGKTFASLWCQVLDISATSDISITLSELQSTDDATDWSYRTMMHMSTTGKPGYVKIMTGSVSGSAVARTYTFNASSMCTYYTYYLTVSLPGDTNTNIKSCAVEYN